MLTAEKIESNWNNFLKIIEDYIASPRKEQLLKFYKSLEDRIILMPASNKPQYHNCFPGGYVDHVLRVVNAAIDINSIWIKLGIVENYSLEELVFSAVNHDLGKIGTLEEEAYIEQTDQWRKDKLGEYYTFNNKIEFMSVPDRSLFLLNQQNIPVSKNELLAIKLHDGLYDKANESYYIGWLPEQKLRCSLPYIIHHADMMATRVEFEREWYPKFGIKSKNNEDINTNDIKLSNKKKTDYSSLLDKL